MKSRLASPDQPVSNEWLNLLARLVTVSHRSEWEQPVSSDVRQSQDYWQRRMVFYEQARAKYAEQLARPVPHKTGRARALSLKTLFGLSWSKWALPEAASIFNNLSMSDQRDRRIR